MRREHLQAATVHVSSTIGDARTHPQLAAPELQGRVLSAGLIALVQAVNGRTHLRAACAVEGEPYPPPETFATMLVQVTREALSNVVKHAGSTQARIGLAHAAQHVALSVTDDGQDSTRAWRRVRAIAGCAPCARAEDAGGAFSVVSTRGEGLIRVIVPRLA